MHFLWDIKREKNGQVQGLGHLWGPYFLKEREKIVTRFIVVIIWKCTEILNHCVVQQEKENREKEQGNLSDKLITAAFFTISETTPKNHLLKRMSYAM